MTIPAALVPWIGWAFVIVAFAEGLCAQYGKPKQDAHGPQSPSRIAAIILLLATVGWMAYVFSSGLSLEYVWLSVGGMDVGTAVSQFWCGRRPQALTWLAFGLAFFSLSATYRPGPQKVELYVTFALLVLGTGAFIAERISAKKPATSANQSE